MTDGTAADSVAQADLPDLRVLDVRSQQLTADGNEPVQFRLQFGRREALSVALHRVCLAEIDDTIGWMRQSADPELGVHEARKALKRLRSMLRLVRDAIGPEVYGAENIVLRDLGRILSPVRTAFVLFEMAKTLVATLGNDIAPGAADDLLESLARSSREEAARVLGDPKTMSHVVTTLLAARSRYERWPTADTDPVDADPVDSDRLLPHTLRHRIPDEFSAIEPSIRRVYRRGRNAMHGAAAAPSAHTFHRWRKRAKYLRHQMEALYLVWPEVIGGLAESLDTLGETLGDEHDLAELSDMITAEPSLVADDRSRQRLLMEIARRRLDLQSVALRIGGSVYGDKPRAFTSRLARSWDAARA
jgi:CHAD domain-containing protein